MATKYMTGRGCLVRVTKGTGSAFKIEGWPATISGGDGASALLTIDDFAPVTSDIIVPIVAADGHRLIYSFGKNFGAINLMGTIYLGSDDKSAKSAALEKIRSNFDKMRISTSKSPVNVSFASGSAYKVHFHSLSFGGSDSTFNSIKYTLQGVIAEKQNGNK